MSIRRTVVLNLGGEGEPLDGDLVVNVYLMHPPLLMRPTFPTKLGFGQVVVAATAGVLPIRDSVVDAVVPHHFPIQFGRLVDGPTIGELRPRSPVSSVTAAPRTFSARPATFASSRQRSPAPGSLSSRRPGLGALSD